MAVGSIFNSAGYGSAFQANGVRPAEQFVRTPVQPVDPAATAQQAQDDQQERQVQAFAGTPSEDERQQALDQGRSRGAFLDIRA
ncbi:hypothetical protein [Rhodospirillum centenum]|uniref:Uncharacterized protein n=1 Tax=Rhodospirillum centenum (strain ATCC 51521 / SW) TaxID=414684 RepID=B6IWR0_RHOCS|nr:hypothetical protein [Rhodospirillum centenum]ACJ00734.1 hypothetical protein RC1_3374 [Rhodospirillum centenum SW]